MSAFPVQEAGSDSKWTELEVFLTCGEVENGSSGSKERLTLHYAVPVNIIVVDIEIRPRSRVVIDPV